MGRWLATVLASLAFAISASARADEETVANVRKLLEPVSHLDLRLDLGVSASWPSRGSRATLTLEIATRPDFWYGVGVTSVPTGPGDITATAGGSDPAAKQAAAADNGFALSARLFKRIGPVVGSAGVIENHGGVGIELRGLEDRLRLEALVWNASFSTFGAPHVRVGGSAQWRWLYVQVGGQDLLDPALRAAYLGVGMRWSDPDLGYLLPWVRR